MEQQEFQSLIRTYHNYLTGISTTFVRSLAHKINWNDRLIEIKGPKGVGKTTLILQHILQTFTNIDDALYASLDNLWFKSHTLKEMVDYAYTLGIRHFFFDEIHYCSNWQTVLKNIYDEYHDVQVVFTGSSLLQLEMGEGDLSRRVMDYKLPGLSFREYLAFEGIADITIATLDEILEKHVQIAFNIKEKVDNIQRHFNTYLQEGYYPFYKDSHAGYEIRLQHVVNQILECDYPMIDEVSVPTIEKTKKMLMVLAQSVPQVPKMNAIYGQLETGRNQGLKMLYALQRADLLTLLTDNTKSMKTLARPEKIFLNNTNLMYALGTNIEIGTVRETFFLNQLKYVLPISYPVKGDFLVDKKYLFEVGGGSKTFDQIRDEPNSFLAVDNTEIGFKNRIPLYLFGILY